MFLGCWFVLLAIVLVGSPQHLHLGPEWRQRLRKSGLINSVLLTIDVAIAAFAATALCCSASMTVPGVHGILEDSAVPFCLRMVLWVFFGMCYLHKVVLLVIISGATSQAAAVRNAKTPVAKSHASMMEVGLHVFVACCTLLTHFPWPKYQVVPGLSGIASMQLLLVQAVAMLQLYYTAVRPLHARLHCTLRGSSSLSTQKEEEEPYWQAYIAALADARWTIGACGPNILVVNAAHPLDTHRSNNTTTILVRGHRRWMLGRTIKNAVCSRRRHLFLLRGQPGIGKTFGFGAGSLLKELMGLLHSARYFIGDSIRHVVVTFPRSCGSFDAVVVDRHLNVSFQHNVESTSEIYLLLVSNSTVWIMDQREHGPDLEKVRGVAVLLTGMNDDTCSAMLRLHADEHVMPCANWFADNQMRRIDDCTPLCRERALQRWRRAGPIPSLLQIHDNAFQRHVEKVKRQAMSMTAADWDAICTRSKFLSKKARDACASGLAFVADSDEKACYVTLAPCALLAVMTADEGTLLDLRARAKLLQFHRSRASEYAAFGPALRRLLLEYVNTHRHAVCWWTDRTQTMSLPHWTKDGQVQPRLGHKWPQYACAGTRANGFWSSSGKGQAFVYAYEHDASGGDTQAAADASAPTVRSMIMVGRVMATKTSSMTGDDVYRALDEVITSLHRTLEEAIDSVKQGHLRLVYADLTAFRQARSCGIPRRLASTVKGSERTRRQQLLDVVECAAISPPSEFF